MHAAYEIHIFLPLLRTEYNGASPITIAGSCQKLSTFFAAPTSQTPAAAIIYISNDTCSLAPTKKWSGIIHVQRNVQSRATITIITSTVCIWEKLHVR